MPAQQQHGYTAGKFAIELDGTSVGFATSVEGGAAVGEVVREEQGSPPVVRKHIGAVHYEPIVLEVGSGMADEFYDWIAATLSHKPSRKDGRIFFLDYNYKEKSELSWTDGLLTEIRFPELDAASKDGAKLRVTISPEQTTRKTGASGTYAAGAGQGKVKQWAVSNFRLSISGIDASSVAWIGPQVVKQTLTEDAFGAAPDRVPQVASVEVPNIVLSVAANRAQDFYDWHRKFVIDGDNGQGQERTGSLEYLSQNLKEVIFTLNLTGLGVYKIGTERAVQGAASIARARVEMYCEEMSLEYAKQGFAQPAPTGTSTGPSPTTGPPTSPVPISPPSSAELVIESLRNVLLHGSVGGRAAAAPDPAVVAARLLGSTEEPAVLTSGLEDGRVGEGRRLGSAWARERASLDELEEIASVRGRDWSALTLRAGHSLIEHLREPGPVPADHVGEIDLVHDPFVEGVVDGAADVYTEVRPHLRGRRRGDIG